jgi:E3 Ubiquitin ligase
MHLEHALWATVALGAGPVLFWTGFGKFRLKRLMENTPTAKIRSMAMGLVEVSGQVRAKSTVIGPFSGQSCAYWEVDVATAGRRGSWQVFHRARSGQPFYLEDETGVALVYPHDARCRVHLERSEECLGVSLPDCYASYMREHRLMLWQLGMLRFRERMLEDGMHVYVLGTATPRANAHVVSLEGELAATGSDGWADRRHREQQRQIAGVIRRGEHERTFLISQDSERALHVTLGIETLLTLVGGPLLALFGLGWWLATLAGNISSR